MFNPNIEFYLYFFKISDVNWSAALLASFFFYASFTASLVMLVIFLIIKEESVKIIGKFLIH